MDKIAVGTRSKVCKVTWKTIHIQTYALKIMNTINKDTKDLQHFLSEYEMLCIMSHLSIEKLIELFSATMIPSETGLLRSRIKKKISNSSKLHIIKN